VCIGGSITLPGIADGPPGKVLEPPVHTDGSLDLRKTLGFRPPVFGWANGRLYQAPERSTLRRRTLPPVAWPQKAGHATAAERGAGDIRGPALIEINARRRAAGDPSGKSTRDDGPVHDRTFLLAQAERFRRLAYDISDPQTERILQAMADEYEARAASIRDDATDSAGGAAPG
jgi:hypothetical protein